MLLLVYTSPLTISQEEKNANFKKRERKPCVSGITLTQFSLKWLIKQIRRFFYYIKEMWKWAVQSWYSGSTRSLETQDPSVFLLCYSQGMLLASRSVHSTKWQGQKDFPKATPSDFCFSLTIHPLLQVGQGIVYVCLSKLGTLFPLIIKGFPKNGRKRKYMLSR